VELCGTGVARNCACYLHTHLHSAKHYNVEIQYVNALEHPGDIEPRTEDWQDQSGYIMMLNNDIWTLHVTADDNVEARPIHQFPKVFTASP
jgi:hypothetical protein